jgi:hypothetical protein
MKRFSAWALIASLVLVVLVPLAFAAAKHETPPPGSRAPGAPIATAISTVTGVAISPLLGTGAYGAYKWFAAEEGARAKLPWYAQPHFWVPALLLVLVCAAKDTFGAVIPPGLKKPFDVLETIENKFSGLIAAGAVVPFALDAMADLLLGSDKPTAALPMFLHSGFATIHLAAFDVTWLINLFTVPFGIAVFAVVWLASHAIHVLILLSPWGAIDAALKAARTGLLGLITLAATINPWVGAGLSIVVIIVSYFLAGWSFRLTVFGTVFCWDFLTLKRNRFTPAENSNSMFSGASVPGVPIRSHGRLVQRDDGALEFVYRPWLRFATRTATVPVERRDLMIGQGLFFSDVMTTTGSTLFSLPPRYRGHEHEIIQAYGMGGGVRPAGLLKAWTSFRDILGGQTARNQPLAA